MIVFGVIVGYLLAGNVVGIAVWNQPHVRTAHTSLCDSRWDLVTPRSYPSRVHPCDCWARRNLTVLGGLLWPISLLVLAEWRAVTYVQRRRWLAGSSRPAEAQDTDALIAKLEKELGIGDGL